MRQKIVVDTDQQINDRGPGAEDGGRLAVVHPGMPRARSIRVFFRCREERVDFVGSFPREPFASEVSVGRGLAVGPALAFLQWGNPL